MRLVSAAPLRLEIPGGANAPSTARSAIMRHFEAELAPARMEELRLLVTELVANSVRHGGVDEDGRVFVEVALTRDRARVVVSDDGRQGDPTLRPPDLGGGGGFGLYLVDRVALAWGAEHNPGLRVWFELARA